MGMLVLVIPLMVSSWLLDVYQLGFQVKMVKDLGLNLMSGFGLLIVVFLSLDQIIPDIERRSIYFILSRVIGRNSYIFGRFVGMVATLAFFHGIMSIALLVLLRIHDGAWFWEIPLGAFVVFLKQTVLVSIILFLATFTTKIVIISLSVLVYVLGHSLDIFRMLAEKKGSLFLGYLVEGFAFFIPDFSLYELRVMVVHEVPIQSSAVLLLSVYSLGLSLFFLSIGGKILPRRDL